MKSKTQKIKVYFLMINLVLSIIAFGGMVNSADVAAPSGTSVTNLNTGKLSTTPPALTTSPGTSPTGIPGSLPGSTPGTIPGGVVVPSEDDEGGAINTGSLFSVNIQSIATKAGLGSMIFGTVGSLAGGDNGALWGALAGSVGGVVSALTEKSLGPAKSLLLGVAVATVIFLLTYKKASKEIVEFHCLPWQAPIGGDDCSLCNNYKECSQYSCKSLGQACDIVNAGTKEQKCVWINPNDVNSPTIEMKEVTKGNKFAPDGAVRPPATGVKITSTTGKEGCIKAFTPLEFRFETNEAAQCRVDYNLTTKFDDMTYYVGGESLFLINHTEKLSLPGPDALKNVSAPELKNDGAYTLFVRCKDANGNFNQDAYSVSFCVEKGPDTTPPVIVDSSIPSGKPVQFNKTKLYLEVYVNEPAECKWSNEDRSYKNMENQMDCDTNVWEMNNNQVYTCRTNLTGIENRKENKYYFRCKDKPWSSEGDRNENKQSYEYSIMGSQPLNIMSISPGVNTTVSGATDTIPVSLEITTDNGYQNGEALCYYSITKPKNDESYILFLETGTSSHKQRQDLPAGNYKYYFKCIDLGGNTAYNTTNFKVESDKAGPMVIRVYNENGELKIITNEEATCSYSTKDCNFEIDSGVEMLSADSKSHNSEWNINQNYYIRCKDSYENQPNPNTCSIIVRPSKLDDKSETILLE